MTRYQVTFSKSLLSSDGHNFKCPQQIIDLDAIDADVASQTAKRKFEHISHVCDWRMRADLIEVSAPQLEPKAIDIYGSLWFRCPVSEQQLQCGIDTDALTLSRIKTLSVKANCPFCHRSHIWSAMDGTLGHLGR